MAIKKQPNQTFIPTNAHSRIVGDNVVAIAVAAMVVVVAVVAAANVVAVF